MTEEQQKLVEENMYLIYAYMKKHNLDFDQFRDVLLEELCMAAINFDPSKNLKFSTFAYVYFYNGVSSEFIRANAKKRTTEDTIIFLDDTISENSTDSDHYNSIPDPNCVDPLEHILYQDTLNDILSCCRTEREKTIIKMVELGYVYDEIAVAFDISKQRVYSIMKCIRKRYKEKFGNT